MSPTFHRTTNWIIDRPGVVMCLMLVLSGLATVGYVAPERVIALVSPPPEIEGTQAAPQQGFERPPDVDPFTLSEADAILVAESDAFFTPSGARALRHVVQRLESLDYVRSVLWMDRVPLLNIFGLPEPLMPRATASQQRFDQARQKALVHPLVAGQLLSSDGQTLLLMVNFDFFFVEDDDDCIGGLRRAAEEAAAKFPDVDISFSVTGRVPMFITAMQSHEANVYKFQLIGYGMIALMSLVLFRGLAAVIIVAMAPALGVFWTLGVLRFFELQHNPFNDVILPVLLSLVAFTDGVHLMVHIRRKRAEGLSPPEAARAGIHEVGLACGLTSLTTAIGFGSLVLAHHEIVREFGWCCVIGVLLTFCAVITSIPLACASRFGRRVHVGLKKSLIDRHLGRVSGVVDYVLHRTRAFSFAGISVTILLALVSLSLEPDERATNALPTRSEPAIALRKMDQALGGLEFGHVNVHWSKAVPSDSREVLDVVGKVDQLLRADPLIGHPLSIRNLIDALPGDGNASDRMSMLELLPPPLKRAFYTPEFRRAKVSFRVQDLGIAKYGPVFEKIEQGLSAIQAAHPEFQLDMSGSAVRRWENLYQIVTDLARSLGTASLVIFIVLAVVYRSLRIGLISIIPNLFPLAVSGSFLVLTGQPLELVSVCAFTVCLGIAVDDTIHFLTRFETERRRHNDQQDAIRHAFTGVGTALIMTTVVLIAGFSTVLFSDSRDHRIFAWMGAITIASALFGDLVFLPALLSRFAPRQKRT